MSVQTFDQTPEQLAATILVTEAASDHLRVHLAQKGKQGVRLSLKEAGCTGFKYQIDEVDEAQPGDIEVPTAKGVRVFVDPLRVAAFKGLQIDYVQQGLNKQLLMINPNIKDECGCGESFSID